MNHQVTRSIFFTFVSIWLVTATPVSGESTTSNTLAKIPSDFEKTYGPIYVMWSDRNQLRLCVALIGEAQKDNKITVEEGQFLEDMKNKFEPYSDAAAMIYAAQETWLGRECGFGNERCTRDVTYTIVAKYAL